MAHRLNTNKQFMLGNGLLAFAVIIVVVVFSYMAMKLQQDKKANRQFSEQYTISLVNGFAGDSIAVYVNDSLIFSNRVDTLPLNLNVTRFAKQSAVAIVDMHTDLSSWFDLSEKGGTYRFEKEGTDIKQLSSK